jgi:hypothetical protein
MSARGTAAKYAMLTSMYTTLTAAIAVGPAMRSVRTGLRTSDSA